MKLRVVIIILYDFEKRFLLQHRSRDAHLLPDHWAFFGGEIAQEETPEDAVRRESYEELAYEPKFPQLILEQDFKEGQTDGHMHVFIDAFKADKSTLRLQEGQGWGWYAETEISELKMIERDRKMISYVMSYFKKEASIR